MNKTTLKKFHLKKAFTLAEVLITLGIIGVVASLTIPTLIENYQKEQTVTKLKKVYSSLAQVVKQSEIDNGPNQLWEWGNDENSIKLAIDTYWKPYLKIMKFCKSYSDCSYPNNSPFVNLDGSPTSFVFTSVDTRISFLLEDGTLVWMLVYSVTPVKDIWIDVNAGKGPNKLSKDVFVFKTDESGLVPKGNGSSCSINGRDCAAKIMRDGWQIKDDYPWN